MRYRVTFLERTDETGLPSEVPPDYLAIHVPDDVVQQRTFVERTAPSALRSTETLDEDDSFLSVGSETWDCEVFDKRQDEFLAAVRKSQMAMECVPLEDEQTR